jgi:hypothetical protein
MTIPYIGRLATLTRHGELFWLRTDDQSLHATHIDTPLALTRDGHDQFWLTGGRPEDISSDPRPSSPRPLAPLPSVTITTHVGYRDAAGEPLDDKDLQAALRRLWYDAVDSIQTRT